MCDALPGGAGAFGVECELIPHDLMKLISSKTNLVTSSLGSGNSCDIIFSFIEDICGENEKLPKHGKKYCDVYTMNKEIEQLMPGIVQSVKIVDSISDSRGKILVLEVKESEYS